MSYYFRDYSTIKSNDKDSFIVKFSLISKAILSYSLLTTLYSDHFHNISRYCLCPIFFPEEKRLFISNGGLIAGHLTVQFFLGSSQFLLSEVLLLFLFLLGQLFQSFLLVLLHSAMEVRCGFFEKDETTDTEIYVDHSDVYCSDVA